MAQALMKILGSKLHHKTTFTPHRSATKPKGMVTMKSAGGRGETSASDMVNARAHAPRLLRSAEELLFLATYHKQQASFPWYLAARPDDAGQDRSYTAALVRSRLAAQQPDRAPCNALGRGAAQRRGSEAAYTRRPRGGPARGAAPTAIWGGCSVWTGRERVDGDAGIAYEMGVGAAPPCGHHWVQIPPLNSCQGLQHVGRITASRYRLCLLWCKWLSFATRHGRPPAAAAVSAVQPTSRP